MLEIKFVRQNLAAVQEAVANRGGTANWEAFTQADSKRASLLTEAEGLRHRRNVASEQIAKLKKEG